MSRYVLRWSDTNLKKKNAVGMESFTPSQMPDMLCRVEELVGYGYQVSVSPPKGVSIDLSEEGFTICDI